MKEVQFYPTTSELPLLLDGRINALVRPMAPQPEFKENESIKGHWATFFQHWNMDHHLFEFKDIAKYSPFGTANDILWCKEPFQVVAWDWSWGNITFKYSDGKRMTTDDIEGDIGERFAIESTNDAEKAGRAIPEGTNVYIDCQDEDFRIRPAITMPKAACRLWLEVLEVKVCKLNEALNAMDWLEGVATGERFINQYGQKMYEANPFVWVATVTRIEKP